MLDSTDDIEKQLEGILEPRLLNRLKKQADKEEITISELISDLCRSGLTKQVRGRKKQAQALTIFQEEYNQIIESLPPEQTELRARLIQLLEVSKLLWQS